MSFISRWFPLWLVLDFLLMTTAGGQTADDRARNLENGLHRVENFSLEDLFQYNRGDLKLADRMALYGVPGLSITVIDDFGIAWSRIYGVLQAGTQRQVTGETLFEAGSTSKLATAAAVLVLVERGELEIDRPVNEVLRDWKIPENHRTKKKEVTLRMLLSHSSGINRPASMFSFEPGSRPSLIQVLNGELPALNNPVQVEFLPGTRHRYSNLAYNVIQLLLQEKMGKPFPRVMQELVFTPLKMGSCTYQFPFSEETRKSVAMPHDESGEPRENDLHPTALAHGGLLLTSPDLAKLTVELMRAYQGRSGWLQEKTVREMFSPQIEPGDDIGGFTGQGLGVFLLGTGDSFYFAHQGHNTPGTCCLAFGNPNTGQGVAVMANGTRGFQLILEILAGLIDEYDWPAYSR